MTEMRSIIDNFSKFLGQREVNGILRCIVRLGMVMWPLVNNEVETGPEKKYMISTVDSSLTENHFYNLLNGLEVIDKL